MYLNAFEEKIILTFLTNLNKISGKILLLKWDTGCVSAIFDTCFEDMDDETEEEFYSFSFIVSSIEGNPPIFVSDDNYCLINYKNFPKTITLDTIKVN